MNVRVIHNAKCILLICITFTFCPKADLVFEEDKGFWVAIETFISTTKRPIVLTASDPHFREKLHRNIEQVSLKRPEQVITPVIVRLSY